MHALCSVVINGLSLTVSLARGSARSEITCCTERLPLSLSLSLCSEEGSLVGGAMPASRLD
jgi:hypothetical protein